jgi:predicted small lipoprotein YifL
MDKSLRIALAVSLLFALAGCGAKGPLILPEKAVPIEAPADSPTDNTPQIDQATTPADEQAEEAVEDPAPPSTPDR